MEEKLSVKVEEETVEVQIQGLIECPICCDYLKDILESHCCHTLYCKQCLTNWRNANSTCPGCRSKIDVSKCTQNIPIQRFVESIPFACPFKLNGCPAKVPRSELEKHKLLCSFRPEKLAELKKQKTEELNKMKLKLEAREKDLQSKAARIKKEEKIKALKELHKDLIELSRSLMDVGAYTEALKIVERAQKYCVEAHGAQSVEVAECNYLMALILSGDAKYEKALSILEECVKMAVVIKKPEKQAEYLVNQGNTLMKLAKYNEAAEKFNEALKLKDTFNLSATKMAEILNAIGLVAKKRSKYDEAIQAYTDAMKFVDQNSTHWSEVVLNLADVHRKKGSYTQAKELYLKSLKKLESMYGENHPQVGEVCNALGMLAKKEGKYNEALNYYKTALKISQHFYGQNHPSVGMYLTNLGDIHRKQGDFKKAEGIYFQAIHILEATLGKNHVEVAEVLNSQGLVLKKRADYAGAEALYIRAIRIITDTFGSKQNYKEGIYKNNLADCDRKRGNYDKALMIYKEALAIIENTLGASHSEAGEIQHNMGLVHHQLGKYAEAIQYYQKALSIAKREFGEKHYKVGQFKSSAGLAYAMLNDYKNAYEDLKQALQILLSCLGNMHIEVADCYSNLGDVCMKLHAESPSHNGKLDEAKKYYQEANKIVQATFGADHPKSKQLASLLFICEHYRELAS